MITKYKIRDVSGWTMFIFGILALILGLIGLLRPEFVLTLLGFSVVDRSSRVAGGTAVLAGTAARWRDGDDDSALQAAGG